MQEEKYKKFERKIHEYCDNNVGEKILFKGFASMWNSLEEIPPRDLTDLTNKIINNLVQKGVLKEVPKESESVYGMYEILPHKI